MDKVLDLVNRIQVDIDLLESPYPSKVGYTSTFNKPVLTIDIGENSPCGGFLSFLDTVNEIVRSNEERSDLTLASTSKISISCDTTSVSWDILIQ